MRKPALSPGKSSTRLTALASGIAAVLASYGTPLLAQDEELEEITVTGSRILRRDYEASSPIVTINADSFNQVSNIGVESALNQLPQFVPGGTQFNSSIQNSATSTPGAATLNLRGLGEQQKRKAESRKRVVRRHDQGPLRLEVTRALIRLFKTILSKTAALQISG